MGRRVLSATAATAVYSFGVGCAAFSPGVGLDPSSRMGGSIPVEAANRVPSVIANAGDSIFVVLPWILALVVAAVVVILLVQTLRNGRKALGVPK